MRKVASRTPYTPRTLNSLTQIQYMPVTHILLHGFCPLLAERCVEVGCFEGFTVDRFVGRHEQQFVDVRRRGGPGKFDDVLPGVAWGVVDLTQDALNLHEAVVAIDQVKPSSSSLSSSYSNA